jgi:hypothetical protein
MTERRNPKKRRTQEVDPRVFTQPPTDNGAELAMRVLFEPDYLKRADESLRRAVAKNLRLVLP